METFETSFGHIMCREKTKKNEEKGEKTANLNRAHLLQKKPLWSKKKRQKETSWGGAGEGKEGERGDNSQRGCRQCKNLLNSAFVRPLDRERH